MFFDGLQRPPMASKSNLEAKMSILGAHSGPDLVQIVQKLFLVQNLFYVVRMMQKICFCKICSTLTDITQPLQDLKTRPK